MTVCVLELGEDLEKINKVNEIMSNLNNKILEISNGQMKFNFENFQCMEYESSTRVVYAKMKEDENYDKLMEIIHLIIKSLVDEEVMEKSKLSQYHICFNEEKQKYHIKLHMTLMNVLFLNKIFKKEKIKEMRNFNAKELLKYMNTRTLPTASIEKFHFSRMREDKLTEKYEMIHSYSLM